MRYLILSDIHANSAAFQAVLADARGQYDKVLNCGDLVGYGPDPSEVLETWRSLDGVIVRGNHDKAVAGFADLEWFNEVARKSVEWTARQLSEEQIRWLAELPQGPVQVDGFTLVHGAPFDEDEYIIDSFDVRHAAPSLTTGLTFFGHTHLQAAFELNPHGIRNVPQPEFPVDERSTFLVNPGSVGQPRDRDARAAYALYESEIGIVSLRRAEYDIQQVHRRVVEAGLPEVLALRLYRGS